MCLSLVCRYFNILWLRCVGFFFLMYPAWCSFPIIYPNILPCSTSRILNIHMSGHLILSHISWLFYSFFSFILFFFLHFSLDNFYWLSLSFFILCLSLLNLLMNSSKGFSSPLLCFFILIICAIHCTASQGKSVSCSSPSHILLLF